MSKAWFDDLVRWEKFQEKKARKREERDREYKRERDGAVLAAFQTALPAMLNALSGRVSESSPASTTPSFTFTAEELIAIEKAVPPETRSRVEQLFANAHAFGIFSIAKLSDEIPKSEPL